jgi:GrpB-like predicted nucleotidyltransferase (UPF0157 family)
MIEVVDHDPAWSGRFEVLRDRCRRALVGVPVVAIEHVGSTSVPGLAAKPVIDVDIVVERAHVDAASAALVDIGFEPLGDLGIVDRYAFRAPADCERTNAYVVVDGSVSLRNHLAVRDRLRRDPRMRDRYGELKRRLAGETDDLEAYVAGKSSLLQEILSDAGFDERERAEIAAGNRLTRPHRRTREPGAP